MPTTVSPSSRSSCVFWADADTLTGQTNGNPLVGTFGPSGFGVGAGLTAGFALPTYQSAGFLGKACLQFSPTSQLRNEHGANAAIDALFSAGADVDFTVSLIFTLADLDTLFQSIFTTYGGRIETLYSTVGTGFVANYDSEFGNGKPLFRLVSQPLFYSISYVASTHTVTIVQSDGSVRTYTASLNANSNGAMTLGAITNGSFAWSGSISQVWIDNVALTVSQQRSDAAYFADRYGAIGIHCLGDSRTHGHDSSGRTGTSGGVSNFSYPTQLQTILGTRYNVFNHGNDGAVSSVIAGGGGSQMVQAVGAINCLHAYHLAVELFGVNDFNLAGLPASTAASNITTGLTYWEGLGSTYPGTFLDIWSAEMDALGGSSSWDAFRAALRSALLSSLPATPGLRGFCDLTANPNMGNTGASTNPIYWSDTLHPVGEDSSGNPIPSGYHEMAVAFSLAIAALLPSAASTYLLGFGGPPVVGGTYPVVVMIPPGTTLSANVVVNLAGTNIRYSATQTGTFATTGTVTISAQTGIGIGWYQPIAAGSVAPTATNGSSLTNPTVTPFTAITSGGGSYPTASEITAAVWANTTRTLTSSAPAVLATVQPNYAPALAGTAPGWYAAPPTDYQQRGNAVTLPATLPNGSISTTTFATGATLPRVTVVDGVTGSVAVSDKTGFKLASDGLDSISVTPAANGVTPNFRQMVVATWRRWFRKHVASGSTLTGYADDGIAVLTTQSIPTQTTDQTQGASA